MGVGCTGYKETEYYKADLSFLLLFTTCMNFFSPIGGHSIQRPLTTTKARIKYYLSKNWANSWQKNEQTSYLVTISNLFSSHFLSVQHNTIRINFFFQLAGT